MSDDVKIWIALVTGVLAFIGTIYASIVSYMSQSEQTRFRAQVDEGIARTKAAADREITRLNAELQAKRDQLLDQMAGEKIVSKFRDPMLHAAYDLQSRIFNLLNSNYLGRYYVAGSEREKEYAIENTVFLVAQFLGWTELLRQEIQFLDLGSEEQTRKLRGLQDGIYTQFHSDNLGTGFRLFPGEQRAVGELMIDRTAAVPRCIGFAAFLNHRNPDIDRWLDPLRDEVIEMSVDINSFQKRLIEIQHSLIDLLQFLDPDSIRFPADHRKKIESVDVVSPHTTETN